MVLALAAAVACFARSSRTIDDIKVNVDVAFMIPHAADLIGPKLNWG